MIQKAVHFQHIAFSNLTVFSDSVFEYLHFFILHHRFVHFILIYIISFFNFTLYSLKCLLDNMRSCLCKYLNSNIIRYEIFFYKCSAEFILCL